MYKNPLSLETLEDRFSLLPKDIQTAVTSTDVVQKIEAIGKKRGLHVDQTGILAEETALVMLGETAPRDFPAKIRSSIGISEEIARGIVEDLNREIFAPIRSSLTSIHAEKTPQEKAEILPTKEEILRHIEDTDYEKRVTPPQSIPLVPKPIIPVVASPSSALPTQPLVQESTPLVKKVLPPMPNLMEQKLSGAFAAPAKQTINGGNERPAPQSPAQPKIDPYRELPE